MSGDGIPPCMGGDLGFLVRMGGLAGIWGSTYTGGFGVFIGILGFCGDEGLGGGGSHLMCGFGIFSGIEV